LSRAVTMQRLRARSTGLSSATKLSVISKRSSRTNCVRAIQSQGLIQPTRSVQHSTKTETLGFMALLFRQNELKIFRGRPIAHRDNRDSVTVQDRKRCGTGAALA